MACRAGVRRKKEGERRKQKRERAMLKCIMPHSDSHHAASCHTTPLHTRHSNRAPDALLAQYLASITKKNILAHHITQRHTDYNLGQ
jgi:hypothetical protein